MYSWAGHASLGSSQIFVWVNYLMAHVCACLHACVHCGGRKGILKISPAICLMHLFTSAVTWHETTCSFRSDIQLTSVYIVWRNFCSLALYGKYHERFGEKVTQIVNNSAELWSENAPGTFIPSLPFNCCASVVLGINERCTSELAPIILFIRGLIWNQNHILSLFWTSSCVQEKALRPSQRRRKKREREWNTPQGKAS